MAENGGFAIVQSRRGRKPGEFGAFAANVSLPGKARSVSLKGIALWDAEGNPTSQTNSENVPARMELVGTSFLKPDGETLEKAHNRLSAQLRTALGTDNAKGTRRVVRVATPEGYQALAVVASA